MSSLLEPANWGGGALSWMGEASELYGDVIWVEEVSELWWELDWVGEASELMETTVC